MSSHIPCTCEKPGDREQLLLWRVVNWRVIARCGNTSAFNGYRWTPSDYSEIVCKNCNGKFRTKAKYVEELKND